LAFPFPFLPSLPQAARAWGLSFGMGLESKQFFF
jgi:hypothetical protein